MANGLILDPIREEYDNIESNKGKVGYPFRKNMTDLIEGVMERGENGDSFCNPKSAYCVNIVSKKQQKTISEKFEVLVWEEAIVKCGNEAALISCIDRKKCFKRGPGDKPDILWPKVSFGRETAWTQEGRFQ